ncbi:MAG: CDP-glucose 4,6-dehydratase [Betaproteobacteria bacterium]
MLHEGVTPAFWKGRRVLLTGHTGFKGGWLALWLDSMGADVSGLSLSPPTDPSFFQAAGVAESITHTTGDLRDFEQVLSIVRDTQPEVVFHLGAQSLVRQSYTDPRTTFSSNVMGTVNLLEAIRETGSVKALLVVTSDKCYENREWLWPYRENEPMGGKDPYSASKGCVELLTAAWRDSFLHPHTSVATARAGNVIGGGDWGIDRLVPDALKAWQNNKILTIRSPKAVRPWQYHLDALAGYLTLASELINGKHIGAWNFGPTDTGMLSVENLLRRLAAAWGEDAKWETLTSQQPHEAMQLLLDSRKARTLLGWKNVLDVEHSVSAIVAWHQAWRSGENMREFSLEQIKQYLGNLE